MNQQQPPILVTGGAGFIGSALVRRLVASGNTVVNVDALTYAGNLDSLDAARHVPSHVFVHADIRDGDALRRTFDAHRPRAVVHLAAESHVDRSIDGPDEFIATNVTGTLRLLQEARRHWSSLDDDARAAFRFVHVSTDEVFGSLAADDPPFSEGRRTTRARRTPPARRPPITSPGRGTIRTGCRSW
jgi:dTDP-glucose 4,6-dehydratase